jgi:hypothetical protein
VAAIRIPQLLADQTVQAGRRAWLAALPEIPSLSMKAMRSRSGMVTGPCVVTPPEQSVRPAHCCSSAAFPAPS